VIAASWRHSPASVAIAMFLGIQGDKPIHHQGVVPLPPYPHTAQNFPLPRAILVGISAMTSQCSAILPLSTRKRSKNAVDLPPSVPSDAANTKMGG
jgi:hypothetical protein